MRLISPIKHLVSKSQTQKEHKNEFSIERSRTSSQFLSHHQNQTFPLAGKPSKNERKFKEPLFGSELY